MKWWILPSRGGWQPKLPHLTLFLLLWTLISRFLAVSIPNIPDGFPSIEQDPGFRDGLPCSEQDREVRDAFPRSEDLQGQAHSEGLNSTSDIENTTISRISRIAEKSERLRQSGFRSSNRARQSQPI